MNTKEKQLSFSIIMPAYNRGFCIERAVNALLGQTYQDFELIIIDDGSTDGTENRIKERYKEYLDSGRIVYIRQPENKGVAAARNEGLKRAKNEWIAYADTDNIPLPDFLETFAAAAETHGNQCIYAQVRHSGSGAVFRELFKYASLLKGNLIDIGAFVHTRSVYERLGGFDESLTRLVDWDLILTYTKKYPPLFIDRIVLKYNDSNRFKRISNTEDYAGNAQRIWRKHAGLMLRLFNRRKSGDTRTVTVFGIPFSYRKNAHPLLYFMDETLACLGGSKDKRYDHIIGLGHNCETSFQFVHYFRFLSSTLFSWCIFGDRDKFLQCVESSGLLFSEGYEEWKDSNMWRDRKYDVAFHGRHHPADLLDIDGQPDEALKAAEFADVRGRVLHQAEDFERLAASSEKKLYILKLPFGKDGEAAAIEFVRKMYALLQRKAVNFHLLVIIERKEYSSRWKELESLPGLYIRTLRFFSPIAEVTNLNKSDYCGWARIFREFRPKHRIKDQKRSYKFE